MATFPYLGETAALGAAICWAVALAIFKAWGEGVSAVALNLAKNAIAVTGLALGILLLHPAPREAQPMPLPAASAFGALVVSGVVGIAISDTFVLAGLTRCGTALTAASFCLSAPLAALLAWLLFGESLSRWEILGVTIALSATAGVAWLANGIRGERTAGGRTFEIGLLYLLLGQIANSFGIALGHDAFAHVDVLYGTLIRIAPAILVLLPITMTRARRRAPRKVGGRAIGMLALGCVIGSLIGLVSMSIGLKYARAGVAAALNATYPIWAVPLSRLFLRERVTGAMVALMLLAVAGIALLFLS